MAEFLMTMCLIGAGLSALSVLLTLAFLILGRISQMTEGSIKSFEVVFGVITFIVKAPFLLLGFVAKGIASGCKWVYGRFTQQRMKLIDYEVRRLEPKYREGLKWSIVVAGKTYHIRSLDDLPEEHRKDIRARLELQAEGIRDILDRDKSSPNEEKGPPSYDAAGHSAWY